MQDWLTMGHESRERLLNAYHEAGHATAMLRGKYPQMPRWLHIIQDGYMTGACENGFDDSPGFTRSQEYLEFRVIVRLAGVAAEKEYFNYNGLAGGPGHSTGLDDYKKARSDLKNIVTNADEYRRLRRLLKKDCDKLLQTYWTVVRGLAEALLAETYLERDRIIEIEECALSLNGDS